MAEEEEDQGQQEEEEVDKMDTVILSLEPVPVSRDISQASSDTREGASAGPFGTVGQATPPVAATRARGSRKRASIQEDLMQQHVSILHNMQQTLVQKIHEDAEWQNRTWDQLMQ